MKADVKERWVSALRSGNYKQTDGTLYRHDEDLETDSFCCLGVLCELAAEDGIVKRYFFEDKASQNVGYFPDGGDPDFDEVDFDVLPTDVIEWAGLNEVNPSMVLHREDGDMNTTAVDLNDTHHLTFSEIADLVEEQL